MAPVAATAHDFGPPIPLHSPRTPAPFPVDALPDWAAAYVAALATATQTPTDLAGCCVLGVLSTAAGGRVEVTPRRNWKEPVNLYLLPVLPPGSRKSAVVADTTTPLIEVEQDLAREVKAQRAEAIALRDIADRAAQKATQAAANAAEDSRLRLSAEAISAMSEAERIVVPVEPRLVADDVTPEAVASLLAEQGGRLAIISAEGGVFDTMAGRYSKGVPVLDVWLKGHAGDTLRVDRKGRSPEYIARPALSLLLAVQPTVLSAIARHGEFRGRGLLARFLYCIPPDNVGHRLICAPPVPDDVTTAYQHRVSTLVRELKDWTGRLHLPLSDNAQGALIEFESEVEPKLRRDGEYGGIRDWGAKLVGAAVRLAGLLHVATEQHWHRTPISADTMHRALDLARYFAEHAQAAAGLLGDTDPSNAAYLLEHLQEKGVEEFTLRQLLTDLPRGRFATADDVRSAVLVLTDHRWVVPLPASERPGPGRRPSPRFRMHDAAQTAQSAQPRRGGRP